MSDDREELHRALAGMRSEYASGLPAKLALIESLWREIGAGAPKHEDLLRVVHSIAGAAGTFGLAEVGDAALDLEEALTASRDSALIGRAIARLVDASRN
jgi:HPt (histidine-containing phosphotransfer) domain-containing protein